MDPSKEDLCLLKTLLLELEQIIDKEECRDGSGTTKQGAYIYALLARAHIDVRTQEEVIGTIEKAVAALLSDKGTGNRCNLDDLMKMLKFLFSDQALTKRSIITDHYRLHISKATPVKSRGRGGQGVVTWDSAPAKTGGKRLDFWCFSSQFSMNSLRDLNVRSLILTSGTLAPLCALEAEMRMPFPISLENPHVIAPHQVWVGVVRRGPGGESLNSSFKTRSSPTYLNDLGNTIVNFCRVIPKGILVFFPSYGVMQSCVTAWQQVRGQNGKCVWDRIQQFKTPVVEPQDKPSFVAAMHLFYAKVQDPTCTGAVFFAVCRGKVKLAVVSF